MRNDTVQLETYPTNGSGTGSGSGSIHTNTSETSRSKVNKYYIVLAGFIANFIVFGISFTFGVFQDFYLSPKGPLHGESVAVVSIIGSVATCLTYMLTIFNSLLAKYLSVKQIMAIGSFILSMGMICASFCNKTWQFGLTQGALFGLGSSMIYMQPVIHAPPYFTTHRGIAMGIVFSGTGIGGLAIAPFSRYLITAVGWQWALRILGFISFVGTFPISFMVTPHPSFVGSANISNVGTTRTSRLLVNLRVAKSWKFFLHISGCVLQAAGYLIPLFYMSVYAQALGFTASQGATFIGINNAVNAISKIIVGFFADRIGRINMLVFCGIMSTISVLTLWLIPSQQTFLAFVVLYGVFSGPIIALLPTCLVELFGIQNYKSITGFMYFSRGIGNFLGSPIAGLFVPNSLLMDTSSYRNAILYNGSVFVAGSICFVLLRGIVASENHWKFKQ